MFKFYFLYILTLFIASSCNRISPTNTIKIDPDLADQRLNLKNFAFCVCMDHIDSIQNGDSSSEGFRNFSAYNEDVLTETKEMADNWICEIKPTYKSEIDNPLSKMICLDFYNSRQLDSFINMQDNHMVEDFKTRKEDYRRPRHY